MAIPILMYHQVDVPGPRGTPLRGLTVAPGDFRRQMELLKALGYQGLCMSELEPYLRGELRGKVAGITLDDGYANNLELALPVLRHCGFTATCYMVSNGMGSINAWDRSQGVAAKPLMDADQLRAWAAAGQEVGAHSCDHADLTDLNETAARQQIEACKAQLEAVVDRPVRHFCYPYGRYGAVHAAMVKAAGYATATTTRRGRAQVPASASGLLELPRVPVWRATTLPAFWLKLATAYEDRKGAPA